MHRTEAVQSHVTLFKAWTFLRLLDRQLLQVLTHTSTMVFPNRVSRSQEIMTWSSLKPVRLIQKIHSLRHQPSLWWGHLSRVFLSAWMHCQLLQRAFLPSAAFRTHAFGSAPAKDKQAKTVRAFSYTWIACPKENTGSRLISILKQLGYLCRHKFV